MLAIINKASDDYWYQFKEIKTMKDLLNIYEQHCFMIEPNPFDKDDVEFWEGFKSKDIPKLEKAKIRVIIVDDYIH